MTPPVKIAPQARALVLERPREQVQHSGDDNEEIIGQLMARTAELERVSVSLVRVVGHCPCDGDEGGSGLAGAVADLTATIGRAPNDATGDEGSGLCRVVAEIARGTLLRSRSSAKAGAAGAAGAFVAIQTLIELARYAGLL